MARGKRYFSVDDHVGITPGRLKRLGAAKQRAYMTHWFATYFEDPVHHTTYITREGGYQFADGGPYDARSELYAEFGELVSDDRIEEVAEELESDGLTEWAASDLHPARQREEEFEMLDEDPIAATPLGAGSIGGSTIVEPLISTFRTEEVDRLVRRLERGAKPSFGTQREVISRKAFDQSLKSLDREIRSYKDKVAGGIGHNSGAFGDDVGMPIEELDDITEISRILQTEIASDQPDSLVVTQQASRLSRWLKRAARWIVEKGAEKTIEKGIEMIAPYAVLTALPLIAHAQTAASALMEWLRVLLQL